MIIYNELIAMTLVMLSGLYRYSSCSLNCIMWYWSSYILLWDAYLWLGNSEVKADAASGS